MDALSVPPNGHVNGDTNGTSNAKSVYEVTEQPLGTTRHIRLVTIGAGASGINLIRTLRLHLTDYEHVVYEKNAKVGGTWFENRYPEWTSFFSPAEEIGDYLCRACEDENMYDEIKTEHQVNGAHWNEQNGTWDLKVVDLKTGEEFHDYCHMLINSSGILNNWKWPDISGLHDFSGDLVHSASWPKDFDYSGKTVAVIGNGSSGIQIMPEIQKDAKQVVHFIGTPTWIVPPRRQLLATGKTAGIMEEIELKENGDFTQSQIGKFKSDPDFYRKFVKAIEENVNSNFPLVLKDTELALGAAQQLSMYMKMVLGGDERLCDAVIPKFAVGCRRLTPGIGYLESLRTENVRVVTDAISKIVPRGIETATGELISLDAIVCATGFDVSFCPRFPIVRREGNLQDKWKKEVPKAYMSCTIPGMPNYFAFLGPNAPAGHGSVFTISEHIAKYVVKVIKKCQMEGIKSISPTLEAVADLHEHTQMFMPRTAWASSCKSWFKNGTSDGPVTALHPGSRIHFFHMLESFRGEDWEYVYWSKRGNRFAYLGNWFSTKEAEGSNSTWYLDEPDKLH